MRGSFDCCISDRGGVSELRRRQVFGKQIEIRAWRLRQAQRPLRTEHETVRADGTHEVCEMVLRRPPNP